MRASNYLNYMIATIFLLPAVTAYGYFDTYTIDSHLYSSGNSHSIDVDSYGNVHVAYRDAWRPGEPGDLKYAFWDGSEWEITAVHTDNNAGGYCSIKVDSNGNPHIAYLEVINWEPNHIRYASYSEPFGWEIESVYSTDVSGALKCISLDLSTSNQPRISFNNDVNLMCAVGYPICKSSTNSRVESGDRLHSWVVEVVDTSSYPSNNPTSIALDSLNNPHITYGHVKPNGDSELRLASKTAYQLPWRIETVLTDSMWDAGQSSSLAIDPNDKPHIACVYRSINYYLTYLYSDDPVWAPSHDWEISFPVGNATIFSPSLAVDSNSDPHISYFTEDASPPMVKYVKWDGDSWVNCIVDVNAWSSLISQPDIALNSDGDPNITYNFKYDNDDACLKYAAWASSSNNTDSNVGVKYETSGFNRLYNTPNPVNGSVTFNFTLPETTEVDLSIYDLSGRKVTTVADEVKEAGDHAVVFDGYLTPGVYIYKLATPESNAVKKMVVIE